MFNAPESGKKQDANGGTKVPPQFREARLALLAQHYQDPLNEGEEESAFDTEGLALTPPYGDVGPKWAEPEDTPLDEGEDEAQFFTVNPTPHWNVEFDPSKVPADRLVDPRDVW